MDLDILSTDILQDGGLVQTDLSEHSEYTHSEDSFGVSHILTSLQCYTENTSFH